MDNELVAVAYRHAASERQTIWKQQAIGNVLERWEERSPDDFERVIYEYDTNWLVDIRIRRDGIGEYGYDTGFSLSVEIDDDLREQADVGDDYLESLGRFVVAVESELEDVVSGEQQRSQFSPKEFAALMLYKRDMVNEARAADALDIAIGTYRGKLGRIREKIDAAKFTHELLEELEDENERIRNSDGYRAYGDMVSIYEADEYPVEDTREGGRGSHHVQNIIDLLEHEHGVAECDAVVDRLEERLDISPYRARYVLERAIDKNLVERDGETVTCQQA